MMNAWWNRMPADTEALPAEVYLYNGVTGGFDPVGSVDVPHGFTAVGDALPPQLAAMIQWVTDNGRVRGRTYLPATTETDSTETAGIGASAFASMALCGVVMTTLQTYAGGEVKGRVYSRKNGTFHDVVSFVYDTFWDTQRRRKPGVGL